MVFVLVRNREGSQPWSLEAEDPLSGERSRVIDKTSLSFCDFSLFPGVPFSFMRTETS